jgi:hypothetical protein
MTIDAMLGSSAELELLYRMIRICYAQQVSIVKREVLNQLSAVMEHSQLLAPRVIKIVQVVILDIIAQKARQRRLLALKVHTAPLEPKVQSCVHSAVLVQILLRNHSLTAKLVLQAHSVM